MSKIFIWLDWSLVSSTLVFVRWSNSHFLSIPRMREKRCLSSQLTFVEVLRLGRWRWNEETPVEKSDSFNGEVRWSVDRHFPSDQIVLRYPRSRSIILSIRSHCTASKVKNLPYLLHQIRSDPIWTTPDGSANVPSKK